MSDDVRVRLYDKEITELPEDLYIPPEAFAIWIEQFEGPLDFLLYLVRKNGLDLTEMAILPITEQYLEYIAHLDSQHFELAGDYLLMAATLIDIKTRLMLPKPKRLDDTEEDPTKNLLERLQIYAQIKEASQRIDKLVRLERDVHLAIASMPLLDMDEDEQTFDVQMLEKAMMGVFLRPRVMEHQVSADIVPLHERITEVSLMLQKQKICKFLELIEPTQGRVGVVVSFVAVLELLKQQLIQITSTDNETLTLNWIS